MGSDYKGTTIGFVSDRPPVNVQNAAEAAARSAQGTSIGFVTNQPPVNARDAAEAAARAAVSEAAEPSSLMSKFSKVVGRGALPAAVTLALVDVGQDLKQGDYRGATQSAAGAGGAIAGGVAGAQIGAVAGSFVPGVGTFVGGFVGGIIGGVAGYRGGQVAGEAVYDVVNDGAIGIRGQLSKLFSKPAEGVSEVTPEAIVPAARPQPGAEVNPAPVLSTARTQGLQL